MYASFLGFCAPYIWTFLNSLFKIEFFNKLLDAMHIAGCHRYAAIEFSTMDIKRLPDL